MHLKDNRSIMETKRCLEEDTNIAMGVILLLVIYYISSLVASFLIIFIYTFILGFMAFSRGEYGMTFDAESLMAKLWDPIMIISLISLVFAIFFIYLFSVKYHDRNKKSLGLTGKSSAKDYFIGILLGIGSIGLIVLVLSLTGSIKIENNMPNLPVHLFILFIIGWIIQGFSEEFLCRSGMMNLMAAKRTVVFAIIANSIIFSLMHLMNPNFTILAAINIFLIGLVFSLIFYIRDNIWMVASFHSFWNMAQSNIFGIQVSGMDTTTSASLFKVTFLEENIINGGGFGIEGGLACTVLSIIFILVCIIIIKNKGLETEVS